MLTPPIASWENGSTAYLDVNQSNERVERLIVDNRGPNTVTVRLNFPETRQADGSYLDGFTVTAQPNSLASANVPAGKLRARLTSWLDSDGETYPDVLVVYNSTKGQPSAFPAAWEKLSYTIGDVVARQVR
jgi:hypothetical protein